MKRVRSCVLLIAVFAISLCLGISVMSDIAPKAVNAKNGDTGMARYVSEQDAPVIDGIMDEAWNEADILITDEETSAVEGTARILWNETGLYFFVSVVDGTANPSDRCNLWVSEKFITHHNQSLIYPNVDGSYYLCLTPEGENIEYIADEAGGKYVDMTGKYEIATKYTDAGYDVEVYVPLFGSTPLINGNSIGFNISIDDYLTNGSQRESYTYWSCFGRYWADPSSLAEVTLYGKPANDNANNGNNTNDQGGSSVETPNEKKGCASGKAGQSIALLASCLGIAAVTLIKYKF